MAKVTKVLNESVVKGRIKIGDDVVAFNGRDFADVLDYVYADSFEEGTITLKNEDGTTTDISYEKEDPASTLGLEFDSSVEICPVECRNNCIFCFVKQLPKGLRDTLYVKDDDYRLSFISGSYITGTNLGDKDIKRILEYKLTPLYVSVHATDEDVRKYMLGIKKAPNIMDLLKLFISNGITIHSQIVLVGGVNDGEILQKSLNDLLEVGVATVAVVPVGLTGHREGLNKISPLNKEQAIKAIEMTEKMYDEHPFFCYCADEMYQIADLPVKESDYYGNFDQIENGVGLIAKFNSEVDYAMDNFHGFVRKRSFAVITGNSAAGIIKSAAARIMRRYPKLKINVYAVENKFFGSSVTVTGLVTATDIINQYGGKLTEDCIVIPSVMLKEFGDVFLDDTSIEDFRKKMNKKVIVSSTTGEGFVRAILHGDSKW